MSAANLLLPGLRTAIAHALGTGSTLCCLSMAAVGQENADAAETGRSAIKVDVTGSNIPTVERETALPIQVITRKEIGRANIQTAAQLVNTISATTSYSALSESQGFNPTLRGFSGGALRGLSYNSTRFHRAHRRRKAARWAGFFIGAAWPRITPAMTRAGAATFSATLALRNVATR